MPDVMFRHGTLYLTHERSLTALRTWPDLRAWTGGYRALAWRPLDNPDVLPMHWMTAIMKQADGRSTLPGDQPPLSQKELDEARVYHQYLAAFPAELVRWVGEYPENHWRLFQAFRQLGTAAWRLAQDGDFALLCMLAHLDRFLRRVRKQNWPQAARLIHRRRHDILRPLGFFPDRPHAQFLRRVAPGSCSMRNLYLLRKMLRRSVTRIQLLPLPRINVGVLGMLRDPTRRRLCSPHLLESIGASKSNDQMSPAVFDFDSLLDNMEPEDAQRVLPTVRSLEELAAVRREWVLSDEEDSGEGNL